MEIIVKKNNKYSLINIQKNNLENNKNNQDEVIENFIISDEQRRYIQQGVSFIYDGKIILGETVEADKDYIETETYKINMAFNRKIKDYFSKYPKAERDQFANKINGANKILNGDTNYYVEKIAEAKEVTPMEMATYIIQKKDEAEIFYTDAEIERDLAINSLSV